MIDRHHHVPVTQQARLLALSRASVYYTPRAVPDADLTFMRCLDALPLELPFAGSRMLRDLLRPDGHMIGRDHVRTLMWRMGISAIYMATQDQSATPRASGLSLSAAIAHDSSTEPRVGD